MIDELSAAEKYRRRRNQAGGIHPVIPLFPLPPHSVATTAPRPLKLPSISCVCVWKGVLLEIHLLGDLIVGFRNIFIRDVILFPQRRLFIKKRRGAKKKKNLLGRDASRWSPASTAKDLRFCRYCCWLQNLTSRCHWQDVAPCQTAHNRRAVIEKFFPALSDIGLLCGGASRLILKGELVRWNVEIQIARLEIKALWHQRDGIVRQNKSAVVENTGLVPPSLSSNWNASISF